MNENITEQMQQITSFWEKATKGQAAAVESAIESSVAVTKASFGYAAQLTEQWAKLLTESTRRFTSKD